MTETKSRRGQFFWNDLFTNDPERAAAFYSGLLGWEIVGEPASVQSTYVRFRAGNQGIGGIRSLSDTSRHYPFWSPFIWTDQLERVVAETVEQGGSVIEEPLLVESVGWMSLLADPQGAIFSAMHETGMPAEPAPASPPFGSITLHELLVDDPEAAIAFYRNLFDLGVSGTERDVLTWQGTPTLLVTRKAPEIPVAAWDTYVRVESLEDARDSVTALGGEVHSGIQNVPGFGRRISVIDPIGAYFSLHEFPAHREVS